ncbi:hypothetical protein [Paenibacillus endoradicis]|uniref:hypothetical protein n=1 Tax=Paenibacillus endoradicis TaxID=2972487 RepID=UPI002159907A|nr:hypothetical protein [Paenibacillus endoradicis]MCR8656892.1 hypothetical protein [Paenibacillus endoradicis]
MKSQIKCVLLMFLLSISITACSINKSSLNLNNYSSTNSNEIFDTSVPTITSSAHITPSEIKPENNKSLAMEAYKIVLQNKIEFYSIETKKKVYLNNFLTNNEIYGTTSKINHFAVLDMDGDKIPEVVLGLTVDENPNFVEVLHYMNGEVYGCFFGNDQLSDLKTDGTFRWLSGGLTYNGYGKLRFQTNSCETDKFAYHESSATDESFTIFAIAYYINNKLVTKDSYKAFVKEEDAKRDVTWYEFSQENISTVTSKTR